jgi:hypothetical protein
MADKRGDVGSRAVAGIAALGAGFATRKVVTLAWKKITGKEPPQHPEDPEVGWAEAMGWAVVMGVAMSTARLLATRLASRRMYAPSPETATDETAAKTS